ncbi:hypothetical protein yrohd0001_1560 [Yersinia rohdei ATCC 43380]|nr:hypothetical protein yrohd0001_1560 [Yersinia rohdei ATCC 43380]
MLGNNARECNYPSSTKTRIMMMRETGAMATSPLFVLNKDN